MSGEGTIAGPATATAAASGPATARPAASGPATAGDESEGRPFGFMTPEGETAMVCEQEAAIREKIVKELKDMGFAVVEATSSREALKFMRFQIFTAIFVDESFDTPPGSINSILRNLESLSMSTRRQTFVVLVSSVLKTMDNMIAYNKSVNLILNKSQINDFVPIFKKATAEHEGFYHVYKAALRKAGKG